MKSVPLILLSICLAVIGQVFLKFGISGQGRIGLAEVSQPLNLLKMVFSPLIIIGLLFYATSAVSWIIVLSRVDLNFAYPFLGLTYVFVLLITKFVFQETVPPIRWVGTLIIILGVVVSSR